MTSPQLNTFLTNEQMQQALCDAVTLCLEKAVEKKGFASLVVSGGSTPKRLFDLLSQKDIDWQNITVSLADDRWVPADHDDSNEKLVRSYLLKDRAAKARFIGLKHSDGDAFSGEMASHNALQELPMPIDALVLGMGEDGHTASLFPCSAQLNEALYDSTLYCKGVRPQSAPHDRITLTLKTLKSSLNIFLQIAGERKRDVFKKAQDQKGSKLEMPIRFFLDESINLRTYWAP